MSKCPKQFHSTDRAIQIHLISNHFREKEAGKGKRAGPPPAEPQPPKITSTRTSRTTSTTITNITSTIIQTLVPQVEMNYTINAIVRINCRLFCKIKMYICIARYFYFCHVQMRFREGGAPWLILYFHVFVFVSRVFVFHFVQRRFGDIREGGSLDCFRGAVSPTSATGSCQHHIYQHLSTTKTVTTTKIYQQ